MSWRPWLLFLFTAALAYPSVSVSSDHKRQTHGEARSPQADVQAATPKVIGGDDLQPLEDKENLDIISIQKSKKKSLGPPTACSIHIVSAAIAFALFCNFVQNFKQRRTPPVLHGAERPGALPPQGGFSKFVNANPSFL